MEVKNLELGRKLEVTIEREDRLYHLNSDIIAIKDNIICVSLILGQYGEPFRFRPGDKVLVTYRKHDRLWRWTNVRPGLARLEGERVHVLVVQDLEGESFNRRAVYRVFLGEEAKIMRKVPEFEGIRKYRQTHPAVRDVSQLIDVESCYKTIVVRGVEKYLSETGIGVYSAEKLPEDAELTIAVETPCGAINCLCIPVRSSVEESSRYKYFYGCRIISVGNDIAKIVNALQRRQLMLQKRDH